MSTKKLPHTDSISELARFWDNHDVTEFENELEEVPGDEGVDFVVNLTKPQGERLKEVAKSTGVGVSVLLHDWISQHLKSQGL